MIIHAFVVLCLTLNATQCIEQEIVPWDYSAILSPADCGRLAFTMEGNVIDREGAQWTVKGVRCKRESVSLTDIQKRLRAAIDP